MKRAKIILTPLSILIVLYACVKEDWSREVNIPFNSSTDFENNAEIGNNRLLVDSSMLTISSIQIQGERLQGDDINKIISSNQILDLVNDSGLKDLRLPIGTYTSLKLKIQLGNNGYLSGVVEKINGNPQPKVLMLPLDYQGEEIEFSLIKEGEVLSIEENKQAFSLTFDLQETLNDVGNGPFNGMLAASQSQTNIDVTTIAGGNFLTNFKEQLLENSSLIVE